jgi:putative DNA modification/repair radical SAM protein
MTPDLSRKLQILADAAKYDVSCASSGSERAGSRNGLGATTQCGICHSFTPDGRCVALLKILLTNCCIMDCQYCVNRRSSDVARVRFEPEEIVYLTMEFYRRNYIEGLFLSSGIYRSADYTMEDLVRVGSLLRQQGFGGYIHLKAVPGASQELLDRAGLVADRLSANIELPTQQDLSLLAPQKSVQVIEQAMGEIATKVNQSAQAAKKARVARPERFAPAGQSTQMVIGATPTPDQAILTTASTLYHKYSLKRVYYSAYSPVPKTASVLPVAGPPLVREHRLYQADWLMRFYQFDATELTTPEQPNLDLQIDPKLAWGLRNRSYFPLDVNRASKEQLLRIPGVGVRSVERILKIRRFHKITLADLGKLRISLKKVRPFIITADHNPDALLIDRDDLRQRVVRPYQQLELFDTANSALTGEV